MNPDELWQIWTQFQAGKTISADQERLWCENIARFPEVQKQIDDDRAMQGLLELHATGDDGFVSRCLTAWEDDRAVATSTELELSDHEPLIVTVDSQRKTPSPTKRRWTVGTIGWCVSAAAAIAVLATTAIVHLTTQQPSQPISQQPSEESSIVPDDNDVVVAKPEQGTTIQPETIPGHDLAHPSDPVEPRESLAPEQLDEINKPSWQPSQIVETDSFPEDRSPTIDPPPINRTVLGTIDSDSKSVWKTRLRADDQFTVGPMILVEGRGTLQFENGIQLKMLGPAELHIESPSQIELKQGQFYAEVPRKVRELFVATPDAVFANPENVRIQWSVGPESGTEALVTRGTIQQQGLLPGLDATLALSKSGFFQSLVRPVVNTEPRVRVAMAQAENDFIGRIDKADDSLVLRSPPVFANLLRQIESPTPDVTPAMATPQNWQAFFDRLGQIPHSSRAEDMQRTMRDFLRAQNSSRFPILDGDDRANSSFSFQATISVNGRQHSIGSNEAPDSVAPGVERPSWSETTDGTLTDVPTPVYVGGVPLRFNSREEFRRVRRLMGR